MQLVVPMAGLGQRFLDAGYRLPKPLIPVDGLPMVVRACADLPPFVHSVFVVNSEHVERFDIDRAIREYFPDARIVVAPELTAGQACSVRLAAADLDPALPVLVCACDNSHLYDPGEFISLTEASHYDCLIWTYRNDCRVLARPQAFGWVDTRPESRDVTRVSCKTPISGSPLGNHVVSGCFWFRSAELMIDGIDALVTVDRRINGEYYLDVVPNMLIEAGRRVGVFEVKKYIGWGTPAELADYECWEQYFAARGAAFAGIR